MAQKQSVFGRMSQLLKANVNALIDKAEDPQKMIDQLIRDYTKEIALNSILNIVRHWLDKDEPESPEELAEILMKSRFMAPHELITFN